MTLTACAVCGTHTNPGANCANCGTPAPTQAQITSAAGYAAYWEAMLEKLQRAAAPKYEVTGVLGYGGMAGVFRADEPRLGRKVAIKVMSPALMMDPQLLERFVQEARTIALLNHPNIVTIYEVDQKDDLHWFAMSYVAGRTLSEVMADSGEQLPIEVVGAWLYQIADALGYAHQQGVIHRDIKPGNVLLDMRGNALVTDFGIAKVADGDITGSGGGLTRTGMLVGTPTYMSPEQCTSGRITGSSDQYSLGAMVYQLLTGEPPFTGPTLAVIQKHVTEAPRSILDLRPDCPEDLADAVHRMLEKRPEDRWPSMSAAIDASGAVAPGIDDPVRVRIEELAARATAVAISTPPDSVREGDRVRINSKVTDANGRELLGRRMDWRTTQPAVAMVVNDELLAFCPGSAQIFALNGRGQASFSVTVQPDPVRDVIVKPSRATVAVGDRIQFDVDVLDLDGSRLEGRAVLWSSSDPDVLRISPTGEVEGITQGEAMIAARSGGKYTTATVVVTPAAAMAGDSAAAKRQASLVKPARALAPRTTAGGRGDISSSGPRTMRASSQIDVRTGAGARENTTATIPGSADREKRPQSKQLLMIVAAGVAALGLIMVLVLQPWKSTTSAGNAPDGAAAPVVADATLVVGGRLPAGARVTASDSTGRLWSITTSPTTLAPGSYRLEFSADGFEPQQTSVVLDGGENEEWSPPIVERAGNTKAPVAVAEGRMSVTRVPAGARVTASDSSGRMWALSGNAIPVPVGRYTLEFSAQGYEPAESTVVLRAGQTIAWSPDVRETARPAPVTAISPPAKGTLNLRGDLPAGATVTARDSTGLRVVITSGQNSLPPGSYVLEFRASGFETDTHTAVVRSNQSVAWTPNMREVTVAKAAPPPVRDVRADQASIASLVREFAAAFNRRDTTAVLPLLPANTRGTWRNLLPNQRDVTEFSATLSNAETAQVDGDNATVRFSILVSFRSANAPARQQLNYNAAAVRSGAGWRLVGLTLVSGE